MGHRPPRSPAWPSPSSTIRSWLAPPRVARIGFDDGSFVLRSPEPLKPYARCVGEWLERWAAETPDAPALAERDARRRLAPAELARAARRGGRAWRRACWA
jgi:hypothetical protein